MELWKDIPGYEGRYQVSDRGRVKSVCRKVKCRNGYRTVPKRVLRPAGSKKNKHLYVVLGHKQPGSLVHYLVAITFLGSRPNGADICHINGIHIDNRAENLRYDTRTENILDVYRAGKRWRKLSSEDASDIKMALADRKSVV